VDDAAGGSEDWAEVWVARPTQTNDFATDATFLGIKFKGHEIGIENVGVGGGG
jgi:hypothetical protein